MSTDNESECDENDGVTCDKVLVTKRRHIHHDEDRSSCYSDEEFHFSDEEHVEEEEEEEDDDDEEGEEEELSEYWDQVRTISFLWSEIQTSDPSNCLNC